MSTTRRLTPSVTAPSTHAPSAPAILSEYTRRDRIELEVAFRKRQALAICRAAIGRRRTATPLLVFTTSRSGSTWLCELLSGINHRGPLPEHLRPQHLEYAISSPDGWARLTAWLEEAALRIRSGRDGGSKLIWDYFPELFAASDAAKLRATLAPLLALAPACIRLRRRDLAEQAVSRYRASLTGVYHHRRRIGTGPLAAQDGAGAQARAAVFDAAAIARHEDVLRRAEAHLDAAVASLGMPVHELIYEELAAAPRELLLPIAARLRGDLDHRAQRQRLQRALDCARIQKAEDTLQTEWTQRYRAERGP
jgi:LPS sulfotransferase NodH